MDQLIIECHRMAWVEMDPNDHLVSTPRAVGRVANL